MSPDIIRYHLFHMFGLVQQIIYYILAFLLIYIVLIHIYLLTRFVRTRYGKRIKPDGAKAILITGATSGFGLLASKYFYKLGFTIFACYYDDKEQGYDELLRLGAICDKSESGSVQRRKHLFLVRMDVRSDASIDQAGKEIDRLLNENQLGLYCLLNNAGTARAGPFELSDRKQIRTDIETNLLGLSMVTRQFLLRIVQSKGRVVNVSSGLFAFPIQGVAIYGSTKSAIAFFSDSLNEDIKQYGCSCHSIMPGNFITVSNIMNPRVQSWRETEANLSQDERNVYKESLAKYNKLIGVLSKRQQRIMNSGQTVKSGAENLGDQQLKSRPARKRNLFSRFITWYAAIFSGGGCSDLEKSGLINGYEQAVCLVNPPRSLYAGNSYFTYVSGPFIDFIPRAVIRLLIPALNHSSSLL